MLNTDGGLPITLLETSSRSLLTLSAQSLVTSSALHFKRLFRTRLQRAH